MSNQSTAAIGSVESEFTDQQQFQKLTEQVNQLQNQVSQLQSELQFVQKQAQVEATKQHNQIQGLSHILIDLVSQSREHEQNRQQFVAQRVHHLFTLDINGGELLPPPPQGLPLNSNMGMNALQQGIQIQQQQQIAQGQLLQDHQQQHALRQSQFPQPPPGQQMLPQQTLPIPPLQPIPNNNISNSSSTKKDTKTTNVSVTTVPVPVTTTSRDTTATTTTTKGKRGPYKKRNTTVEGTTEDNVTTSPKRRKTNITTTATSVPIKDDTNTNGDESFQNVAFVKAPNSVAEIWNEYTVGLTPNTPSIKSLEEQYKTSWRREPAVAKKYNRRKPIYMAIERGLARGLSLDECLNLLENHRIIDGGKRNGGTGAKQPIGWLGHGNLPEELKEKEKDFEDEEEKKQKKEKEKREKIEKREQAKLEKERLKAEKAEKAKAIREAKKAAKHVKDDATTEEEEDDDESDEQKTKTVVDDKETEEEEEDDDDEELVDANEEPSTTD